MLIRNYADWSRLNEAGRSDLYLTEGFKIRIRKGRQRRKTITLRRGGSEMIDPMSWEQEIQTPEEEWDSYLAENEAGMMSKMSESSRTHWQEIKGKPESKGYAVAALERFIETDPKMRWQRVFCDSEEGIRQELQQLPKPDPEAGAGVDFNGISMPVEFPLDGPSNTFFGDNQWEPTEDFKTRLEEQILAPLREMAKEMQGNPDGEEPKFFLQKIEIHTSCSRYRNTGPAESMTFKELSQARNDAALELIKQRLEELGVLIDEDTETVQDVTGENGDGSSGPNPPTGVQITRDGRAGSKAPESERGRWGDPIESKGGYDKFKYCIAGLEIVANTKWMMTDQDDVGPSGTDEEWEVVKIDVPTLEYGISFYSRPRQIKLKWRWPRIEITKKRWFKKRHRKTRKKPFRTIDCPKW